MNNFEKWINGEKIEESPKQKKSVFDVTAEEYELALKTGKRRFGSFCKHENVKNGICKDCLRTVKVK